ncbi:DNA polymerase III subunit delta' [Candidatus Steffania adelgidicola]|uniref:DNA polymerase III subunit delta' n=1 Tax=Candidatus Steffania adelgidicola TaxID=1076626 RepID=UPI001D02B617|nr:DNA polymerase III subunit delta' [Candidatus Steffania adelgidicola]
MKWYPWLNSPYRQILTSYQQKRGHHALLLHSQSGNGEASLCYALSRWLICRQPDGIKSCGNCHSCQLMKINNHPDVYQLQPEQGRKSLGIDSVRSIIDSLYARASQGGAKVIHLSQSELLTEQAANALLKTLEEPPDNTYFILICQTPASLLPTLRSRCLYWPLPAPEEELSFRWLRKAGYQHPPLSTRTALRLCGGAPLAAEALLKPVRWQDRLTFCRRLQEAHETGNFLELLPILNREQDNGPLHWMLSLISDALKYQHGAKEFLLNADRSQLVALIAARWATSILHVQWQQWLYYIYQCQEISGINRELLLTKYLLNWEQAVKDVRISL